MSNSLRPTFFELLKQALSSLESGYDKLAPKFDQSDYVTPRPLIVSVFDRLKKEYGSFERGVDVCCGTGEASRELIKLCTKHFSAIDLSQGMLDQCIQKLNDETHVEKEFVKGNALDLPFQTELYDIAVSFGAFGHFSDKEARELVRQIKKVLKPGAPFCFITTWHPKIWQWCYWRQILFNWTMKVRNALIKPKFIMYYLKFRLPEVQSMLEEEGFEVELIDDFLITEEEASYRYLIPAKEFVMVKATRHQ